MLGKRLSDGDLGALFDLIDASEHCVAFTGAGVSTLSGVRDFRGRNGLYKEEGAERIFDLGEFLRDPSFYYRATRELIYGLEDKRPSAVHEVLAALERMGVLKALITQNIDLLHRKAGNLRVIEVHGSPLVHRCLVCGSTMTFPEAAALVRSGSLPRCPDCARALKPDITFFGEALPPKALRDAEAEARAADLMLVLGSTLQVYPAASLPELCLDSGGRIVIVNDMPTYLDGRAALRFDELGSTFEHLASRLGEFRPRA